MLLRVFAVVRGLVYATGFVVLWWWIVVSARPFDSRVGVLIPGWARGLGVGIAILGGAIALYCIVAFAWVGKGTPAPFDAPRDFVAVGPYRFVRNPMYLGAATVITGVGLMLRSPSTVGVAILFVAVAHVFVLFYEEPALERRFGDSYLHYKESVHRWLPRIPRREHAV